MMQAKPHSALVLIGHGSTLNPDSSTPTMDHAETIRRLGLFQEVVCAFWKEEPALREVLRMVDSREVYVVPNFISEGYFTQQVIPRELGLTGETTQIGGKTVHYCDPVGLHAGMTRLLLARAAEVAPGVPPEECSLIIVGHGTGLNENSTKAIKDQVALIRQRNAGFAEVIDSYMEQEPLLAGWDRLTTAPNVIVVPFFIADGLHSFQDIPVLLGIESEPTAAASQMEVFRHNPHEIRGRRLFYSSAIGTEPMLADVILDQVEAFDKARQTAAATDENVTSNSLADTPALPGKLSISQPPRSILASLQAWLEQGGSHLGEVAVRRVTIAAADATGQSAGSGSGWILTHHSDADLAGTGALVRHTDAASAREIARHDAAGEFRPLKSAPTLKRGWEIVLSSLAEVRLALDYLNPAALANVVRLAEGSVPRLTLKQMLGRQTGMYRVTGLIRESEAQELVAETCQDSKCLRKIIWPWDENQGWSLLPPEKTICPPPPRDGSPWPLICTDACPLLVGAARELVRARQKAEAPPVSTPVPAPALS
ncbi:MAG: hypothetical protein JWM59_4871 [Verrucomicrobiales bacterium]|nr:hypothetical protein [Verrucomicrobiales bacterium]